MRAHEYFVFLYLTSHEKFVLGPGEGGGGNGYLMGDVRPARVCFSGFNTKTTTRNKML